MYQSYPNHFILISQFLGKKFTQGQLSSLWDACLSPEDTALYGKWIICNIKLDAWLESNLGFHEDTSLRDKLTTLIGYGSALLFEQYYMQVFEEDTPSK